MALWSFFISTCLMLDRFNAPTDLLPILQSIILRSLLFIFPISSTKYCMCTELLSPGAPPLHSLNKAQLRKIFLSFPDSRVKIVVYLRPKEILNRSWQEAAANINIYSDWDLWYLQHGPAPGQNSFTRKKWEILFQDWQHSSQQGVLWELQTQFYDL